MIGDKRAGGEQRDLNFETSLARRVKVPPFEVLFSRSYNNCCR